MGLLSSSQVIYTAGAVPGKTVLLRDPMEMTRYGPTGAEPCSWPEAHSAAPLRAVQMPVSAMVVAKAHAHLPLPSRGALCLRYCLRQELQPFGEPERVCAAISRASQLQRGLAHAGFCLPRCVHGCMVV